MRRPRQTETGSATPRVVVITGASSGIGRATALRFARTKASLVHASRSEPDLIEVAAECRKRGSEARTIVHLARRPRRLLALSLLGSLALAGTSRRRARQGSVP